MQNESECAQNLALRLLPNLFNSRNTASKHAKYPNNNFSREMFLMQLNILSRFLSKQAKESNGTVSNSTAR
jgi:hypothetical protein